MPPLLGYDAVAVEMLAIVLRRLWGSEDDNDGQTVAGILHEEGFVKFSAQICDSAPRRFDAESKSAEKGIKLSVGEEFGQHHRQPAKKARRNSSAKKN